jgi:hypothetical protein
MADEAVIHTTVDRLEAVARAESELRNQSDHDIAWIAELQDRLMQGRQHPKPGPPFVHIDLEPTALVPLNPPTAPWGGDASTGLVELYVNTNPSDATSVNNRSEVHEPAVAASGDRVFYTANWYTAASSDGGDSFSYVNPSPGPFPAPSGEVFCCDQSMAHDPGSNTVFWLQQFIPRYLTSNPQSDRGTHRINVDQNADGSWNCAYDIDTVLVGFSTGTWFDFPDLAVSSNYLYHASNAFTSGPFMYWAGAYAGRYPLSELASCSTPLTIDGYRGTSSGSFRFSRGADTTMYFASHQGNSALRIWTWRDVDTSPASVSRTVTPWSSSSYSCPGPDSRNWCGRHDGRIQGGFVTGSTVGFMWTPSQGGSFPFPYIRIATFDAGSSLTVVDNIDIWSPDVAYMYPSVSVNSEGRLGGTVMWGGGDTHYASCSAWMADSPTAADLVPLDHTLSIAGSVGPQNSDGRSGDYTLSEVYYPDAAQFVGACFAYQSYGSGTATYMRFGRGVDQEIFSDGFESGGTGAWN